MVCQDGFITSHAVENIELLEDEKVKAFVGEYEPEEYLLNAGHPLAVGPYGVPAYYMESKRSQAQGMINAKAVALDVAKEFAEISGRSYGLFEEYKLDDADFALVIIGSSAGTAKDAVDKLREQGIKAGILKIRLYRPFPAAEIAAALKNVKVLAVMDRAEGMSSQGGPLGYDVKAALYDAGANVKTLNYIYGLGGRDVTVESLTEFLNDLQEVDKTGNIGDTYRYLSVRD